MGLGVGPAVCAFWAVHVRLVASFSLLLAIDLFACGDDALPGADDSTGLPEVDSTSPDTALADTAVEVDTVFAVDAETAGPLDTSSEIATADIAAPDIAEPGCFSDASPGHHQVTCGTIVFEVEIPAACATSACGLILDIHGLTMSADLEDANTLMRERGRAAGYVVVQPSAPVLFGVPTWNLETDADPIFAFLHEVARVARTDPNRAYVMGFSQGGALTWQLVCAHADFFAAASPLGALPGCSFEGADVPSREVDMLIVHGRKDTVVAFNLHEGQRDDALAYWPFGQPSRIEGDGAHLATRWTTPSGSVLETWEHDYTATSLLLNGHCVPGSPHLVALLAFGCQQANTFSWGDLALAFFEAHTR